LDKAVVVQAAADLANREGPEALTLHRLAAALGIQTPSLYNHVDGMPGLRRDLALLNARRLGERLGQAVQGRSGSEAVRTLAQAFRSYIKSEPGLYQLGTQRIPGETQADPELEAAMQRAVMAVLAVMRSFDLEGEDGIHAVRGLRSLVHGFATLETAGGFGMPLDLDESFRRMVDVFIEGLGQRQKQY
jgi:AcrR family transcriptional regulator